MKRIVHWSDRNCMISANLNIWVESWQHVHSIWKWGHWYWTIWAFLSGWHANHKFEYIQTFTFNENVARSDVLMKKVSWFFYQSQILMCATFTVWFDWDFYQLMFLSITIYKEILIFTFPFILIETCYQLMFFSITIYR